MLSADLALALLINRTTQAYQHKAPAYISYREQTRISVPALGRTQEVDRSILVRNSDNVAIMRDLPNGAERTGQAFPIIPYFDPLSTFSFAYYANLKNVTITLDRKALSFVPLPPNDTSVDTVVPYFSALVPHYVSVSPMHLHIDPTSRVAPNDFYTSDIIEDPQTHLPSHIEMRSPAGDESVALDFQIIEGHWIIVHGIFTSTQHVFPLGTFTATAETHFDRFSFPATAPDSRL